MNKSSLGIISLIIGSILIGITFFLNTQDIVGIAVMTAGIYLSIIGLVLSKKIRRTFMEVLFAWK